MPQWLKDLGNWFKDIVTSHPWATVLFVGGLLVVVLVLIFTGQLTDILTIFTGG